MTSNKEYLNFVLEQCTHLPARAIIKAVEFTRAYLGVEMELHEIKCTHSVQNNQCIKERCPFR